jgi:hypothetical protein
VATVLLGNPWLLSVTRQLTLRHCQRLSVSPSVDLVAARLADRTNRVETKPDSVCVAAPSTPQPLGCGLRRRNFRPRRDAESPQDRRDVERSQHEPRVRAAPRAAVSEPSAVFCEPRQALCAALHSVDTGRFFLACALRMVEILNIVDLQTPHREHHPTRHDQTGTTPPTTATIRCRCRRLAARTRPLAAARADAEVPKAISRSR